jgi:hypothetical protein
MIWFALWLLALLACAAAVAAQEPQERLGHQTRDMGANV